MSARPDTCMHACHILVIDIDPVVKAYLGIIMIESFNRPKQ